MPLAPTLPEAEVRAAAARARLAQTVNGLQDRLNPKTLAREAAENFVETSGKAARAGADTLRENPGKIVGAVAIAIAFFARHRIMAAVRKGNATSKDDGRSNSRTGTIRHGRSARKD